MRYFETIRCHDYDIYHLNYHKHRVARTIGLNIDLNEYINPPSEKNLKVKLIYDETAVLSVSYETYIQKEICSFVLVYDDDISYDKKFLDRSSIDILSRQKGKYDEIIIVKNGKITDTAIANIAIKYGDRWLTPKKPLLHGTTRQRLLDSKQIVEENITTDMLLKSDKIALLNSMIGFDKRYNKEMII